MKASIVHYYFYKKLIENIPDYISTKMDEVCGDVNRDALYFNIANFNDVAIFYRLLNPFKKDKYQVYDKFHDENFFKFFESVIEKVKLDGDVKELYLAYAMIAHYILEEELEKYLATKIYKKMKLDKAYNYLDVYLAEKNDNIKLNKVYVSDIFGSFKYEDFIKNAISSPLVKTFDFLLPNDYYNHCYKQMNYYYSHLTRSKFKKLGFILYDVFFNHRHKPKAINYIYPAKINELVLNTEKKKYLLGDQTYDYSFDEILDVGLKKAQEWVDAINQYIYDKKDFNLKNLLKSQA